MFRAVALSASVIVLIGGLIGTRIAQILPLFIGAPVALPAQMAVTSEKTAAPRSARAELLPDPLGHYRADAEIDGHMVRMLVDTGASLVSLTSADAAALGIVPFPSDYTVRMQTANGVSLGARETLRRVRIGGIEVDDVEAIVLPEGAATQSLLGMSFLKRLNGFEAKANRLVLQQ